MRKNINVLFMLLAFATICSVTACSKKDNTQPSTCSNGVKDGDETGVDCGGSCTACSVAQARLKTIARTTPNLKTYDSIAYDNRGRQILLIGDQQNETTYMTDSVLVNTSLINGVTAKMKYVLNSDKLAVTATSETSNGTAWDYKYTYDSQGYLIQQVSINAASSRRDTTIYTWTDGNLTSEYIAYLYYNTGQSNSNTYTYTYYNDKENSIGNESKGIAYLGKSSKNLLKSADYGFGPSTYTYTFDSSGRVTSEGTYMLYTYY